jgi:cytoskeletal protein CcmA (bactofilin family)
MVEIMVRGPILDFQRGPEQLNQNLESGVSKLEWLIMLNQETRPGRPVEERRLVAWVGKSVTFKGELVSSEDMAIDGRVEGTIDVRGHTLTIGPGADIRATIQAGTVTVDGAVNGKITAEQKVEIRPSGSVEGDIVSPRLAMADGAILRGRVGSQAG